MLFRSCGKGKRDSILQGARGRGARAKDGKKQHKQASYMVQEHAGVRKSLERGLQVCRKKNNTAEESGGGESIERVMSEGQVSHESKTKTRQSGAIIERYNTIASMDCITCGYVAWTRTLAELLKPTNPHAVLLEARFFQAVVAPSRSHFQYQARFAQQGS